MGLRSLCSIPSDYQAGAVLIDEGLELLDETEAMRLLAHSEVGRVGITIGAMPAIFPVNYRLIDGSIVFRTAPGSKLTAASRAPARGSAGSPCSALSGPTATTVPACISTR